MRRDATRRGAVSRIKAITVQFVFIKITPCPLPTYQSRGVLIVSCITDDAFRQYFDKAERRCIKVVHASMHPQLTPIIAAPFYLLFDVR